MPTSQKRTAGLVIVLAVAIVVLLVALGMAWDRFNPNIRHDGDSLFYAQYIRNLLRYPLSDTAGLMANLVGVRPSPFVVGASQSYYGDHPMGVIWLGALVHALFTDNAILAGRWTNIISVLAMLVTTLAYVLRRLGLAATAVAALISLSIPLLWEHLVVIGLQATPLAFTVGAAICFTSYLSNSGKWHLAGAIALWMLAMLCDWPGFLLGGPIAVMLATRGRWKLLAAMGAIGVGTMNLVFFLQVQAFGFDVQKFIIDTFRPLVAGGDLHLPLDVAAAKTWDYAWRAFGGWSIMLFLPLFFPSKLYRDQENARQVKGVWASLLFVGLANDVLFIQWAATHSYWSFFLIPALVLAGALVIQLLLERTRKIAFVACAAASVVVASNVSSSFELTYGNGYFQPPAYFTDVLRELSLQHLVDPGSTIFVSEECAATTSACHLHRVAAWSRYMIDKPGVPARPLDRVACSSAYFVMPASLQQTHHLDVKNVKYRRLELLDWIVVPGANLDQRFCHEPSALFMRSSIQ